VSHGSMAALQTASDDPEAPFFTHIRQLFSSGQAEFIGQNRWRPRKTFHVNRSGRIDQ
jgi:hypothetical protein